MVASPFWVCNIIMAIEEICLLSYCAEFGTIFGKNIQESEVPSSQYDNSFNRKPNRTYNTHEYSRIQSKDLHELPSKLDKISYYMIYMDVL